MFESNQIRLSRIAEVSCNKGFPLIPVEAEVISSYKRRASSSTESNWSRIGFISRNLVPQSLLQVLLNLVEVRYISKHGCGISGSSQLL